MPCYATNVYQHLNEAEVFALQESDWLAGEIESVRRLLPDLLQVIRTLWAQHGLSCGGTCRCCFRPWPCASAQAIHDELKHPDREFSRTSSGHDTVRVDGQQWITGRPACVRRGADFKERMRDKTHVGGQRDQRRGSSPIRSSTRCGSATPTTRGDILNDAAALVDAKQLFTGDPKYPQFLDKLWPSRHLVEGDGGAGRRVRRSVLRIGDSGARAAWADTPYSASVRAADLGPSDQGWWTHLTRV